MPHRGEAGKIPWMPVWVIPTCVGYKSSNFVVIVDSCVLFGMALVGCFKSFKSCAERTKESMAENVLKKLELSEQLSGDPFKIFILVEKNIVFSLLIAVTFILWISFH